MQLVAKVQSLIIMVHRFIVTTNNFVSCRVVRFASFSCRVVFVFVLCPPVLFRLPSFRFVCFRFVSFFLLVSFFFLFRFVSFVFCVLFFVFVLFCFPFSRFVLFCSVPSCRFSFFVSPRFASLLFVTGCMSNWYHGRYVAKGWAPQYGLYILFFRLIAPVSL